MNLRGLEYNTTHSFPLEPPEVVYKDTPPVIHATECSGVYTWRFNYVIDHITTTVKLKEQ